MYGGSASGGKSDALLMAALEWVDHPGYAALLLRRTFADLALPGALMDRARSWLSGTDAHWEGKTKTWTFPSGSTLSFGFLEHTGDMYRYQGAEFGFCGFDELTQFTEAQYRYLFSRLRRVVGAPFIPKMRAASNPGGIGHEWVRQRFIVENKATDRAFVPANLYDNPHVDQESYARALDMLDPVTRAQLLLGDWNARHEGSIFSRDWFEKIDEAPSGLKLCWFWDLAATEPKPGQREPDWTVGTLMGRDPLGCYYVLHVERLRGTPETVQAVMRACAERTGKSVPIYIEQEPGSAGIFTCDHLVKKVLTGFAAYANKDGNSKPVRAAPFSAQCQRGNVKVLRRPWVGAWFDELEAFPQGSHDDQVDSASGAFKSLQVSQWWQDPLSFQWLIGRLRSDQSAVADGVNVADLLKPGTPAGWTGTAIELEDARARLSGVMSPRQGGSIEQQSRKALPGRQVFFAGGRRPH